MSNRKNRAWRLAARPAGAIKKSDFRLAEEPVLSPKPGEALVRTIYLSLDPTNRIWMSDVDQYMPPVGIGDVMRGGTIGVVEESNDPNLKPGEIVQGMWGWQDYACVPAAALRARIPAGDPTPLTAYMSVLGGTGLTAYFGLLELGQPKEGETVVVSAAAGAVGSIVGQIAKLKGCRVVGIAGTDEKCRWLTAELGFDAAINYRRENVLEALRKHCPKGIDVDFENVGGDILDAVLTLVNNYARVVLCGLISTYNENTEVPGPAKFANILMKRVKLQGFIVTDFLKRFPEGRAQLAEWVKAGKLKYQVDVVPGLENAPKAVGKLFTGENKGKLMVQVSEEPKR
ncbi:NADP-dependent oxidoreductase [Desertibaculum subflavum]|uniref:NADP-dependent oxidoreductase n=1 Tax=Desertibaculum subflavum TaxID=2268458 RepID=UPI000E66AA9B